MSYKSWEENIRLKKTKQAEARKKMEWLENEKGKFLLQKSFKEEEK